MRKDRVSPVLAAGPCRSFQGNAATGGGSFGSSFRVYQARFGYGTGSEIASCHGERSRFLPLQVQLDFPFQTEPDCVIPSAAASFHREGGHVRSGRTRPHSVIPIAITLRHSDRHHSLSFRAQPRNLPAIGNGSPYLERDGLRVGGIGGRPLVFVVYVRWSARWGCGSLRGRAPRLRSGRLFPLTTVGKWE